MSLEAILFTLKLHAAQLCPAAAGAMCSHVFPDTMFAVNVYDNKAVPNYHKPSPLFSWGSDRVRPARKMQHLRHSQACFCSPC